MRRQPRVSRMPRVYALGAAGGNTELICEQYAADMRAAGATRQPGRRAARGTLPASRNQVAGVIGKHYRRAAGGAMAAPSIACRARASATKPEAFIASTKAAR